MNNHLPIHKVFCKRGIALLFALHFLLLSNAIAEEPITDIQAIKQSLAGSLNVVTTLENTSVTCTALYPLAGFKWRSLSPSMTLEKEFAQKLAVASSDEEFQNIMLDKQSTYGFKGKVELDTSTESKYFEVDTTSENTTTTLRYWPDKRELTSEDHLGIAFHMLLPNKGYRWRIQAISESGMPIIDDVFPGIVTFESDFAEDIAISKGVREANPTPPVENAKVDEEYWTSMLCLTGETYAIIYPRGKEPTSVRGKFQVAKSSDWRILYDNLVELNKSRREKFSIKLHMHHGLDTGGVPNGWTDENNPGYCQCFYTIGPIPIATFEFSVAHPKRMLSKDSVKSIVADAETRASNPSVKSEVQRAVDTAKTVAKTIEDAGGKVEDAVKDVTDKSPIPVHVPPHPSPPGSGGGIPDPRPWKW